ncbi:DedA family protein [Aminiphilus circumscriptus]|jgi:membrane protein DedA with SNARE-associated domain|uniref:DedA family protein n=1 Tax=Aminiphilus circumscriptus TaxID=290732 RepID=UPI0004786041|nr:DedA family protein [Aminiphilus circumscriptus]
MLSAVISWIVATIGKLGYPGIAALMFLESSFFPFPSEVVVPPAGYLASQGEMSLPVVIAMGILGSLLGAWFNYWIAVRFGRPFFERFGKYVLVSSETLDKADRFFARHGHISTFVGRLIPGIRQYISLPAGVARMNLAVFSLFTALGAGIWVVVLALVGYWVGNNQVLVMNSLHKITVVTLGLCVVLVAAYVLRLRKNRKLQEE